MSKNSVKIKVQGKKKDRTFNIENFPVFIGSGKANDIIPLNGEGVEPRHAKLFLQKKRLFFEDLSKTGSKVNDKNIKNEKVKLEKGANSVKISRYSLLIVNQLDGMKKRRVSSDRKRFVSILSIVTTLFVLFFLMLYFGPKLLSAKEDIGVKSFSFEPYPLNTYQRIKLDEVVFKPKDIDKSKLNYSIYFYDNGAIVDSVYLKNEDNSLTTFSLPSSVLEPNRLKDTIKVKLKPVSNKYNIKNNLISKFLVDNMVKIQQKNGFKLRTKVKRMLLVYELINTDVQYEGFEIDFGDNDRINRQGKLEKGRKLYDKEGKYNFQITFNRKNAKDITFKRTLIIKNRQ